MVVTIDLQLVIQDVRLQQSGKYFITKFIKIYASLIVILNRSTKLTSSTALSHARDIETIYGKSEFLKFTHTTSNGVTLPKPVLISIVDGTVEIFKNLNNFSMNFCFE